MCLVRLSSVMRTDWLALVVTLVNHFPPRPVLSAYPSAEGTQGLRPGGAGLAPAAADGARGRGGGARRPHRRRRRRRAPAHPQGPLRALRVRFLVSTATLIPIPLLLSQLHYYDWQLGL